MSSVEKPYQEYVIVFPIRHGSGPDHNVLLVRKNRPEWQKGRLNLVGGKIEPGETPEEAAVRELYEEAGFKSFPDSPDLGGMLRCGKINFPGGCVYALNCNIFTTTPGAYPVKPQQGEDEHVGWYPWFAVQEDPRLIPNLRVIIPLLYFSVTGWEINDPRGSIIGQPHEISMTLHPTDGKPWMRPSPPYPEFLAALEQQRQDAKKYNYIPTLAQQILGPTNKEAPKDVP
jgi:8-oxo-dGTP pyrophosphatase MutT (NUDIX family)